MESDSNQDEGPVELLFLHSGCISLLLKDLPRDPTMFYMAVVPNQWAADRYQAAKKE